MAERTTKRVPRGGKGDNIKNDGAKGAVSKPARKPVAPAAFSKSASSKPDIAKTSAAKTSAAKTPAAKTARAASAGRVTAKAAPTRAASGRAGAAKRREGAIVERQTEPAQSVQLGFLSEFLGFHLRLAQDAASRGFGRTQDKDTLKPGRFPALAIIHLNPGISQSALGRAIARDKSTVSPLIKDLQTNGFISRKPSAHDGRSVTLALTKKGERTLERMRARAVEHEAELDRIVGTSKGRLVTMLERIVAGMAG